jgi:protein ImuA
MHFPMQGEFCAMKSAQSHKADAERGATVARLGAEIARIERRAPSLVAGADEERPGEEPRRMLSTGHTQADLLVAGTPAAALHEVRAPLSVDSAAAGCFALALGLRAAAEPACIFWIADEQGLAEAGVPYGPGISALGLGDARIVRVLVRRTADALWAAGEVSACSGAGLCILELRGNPRDADLALSRRLAMRARESGTPVILLRQGGEEEASAALTRWRVEPAPSDPGEPGRKWVGPPAFSVRLEKSRGGRSGEWIMEWNGDERLFAPFGFAEGIAAGPSRISGAGRRASGAIREAVSFGQSPEAFHGSHREASQWPGMAARRAS